MAKQRRIAIIGAGPIGLEAALYAVRRGYAVSVFERGRVAENVRQWGHVRMFSPFGMNASEWGRAALQEAGHEPPADDALLSGGEFVEQYVQRLRYLAGLREAVFKGTTVVSVARRHALKSDDVSDPARERKPFRLLLDGPDGERTVDADVVLDCSGTYGNHNRLGDGGILCPGELAAAEDITYAIPTSAQVSAHVGAGSVLVVGSGYSAATTVIWLAELYRTAPESPLAVVYWVTRKPEADGPVARIPDDTLTERDRIARDANALARDPDGPIEWLPGHVVRELEPQTRRGGRRVVLENVVTGAERSIEVDRIVANVGYRPDRSIYEELQIHECYATQGPMKLAAKLLGESSVDCLDQTSHGPEALRNPEPNFYILGAKSYGRNSKFLIQVGLAQIVDVFTVIEREWPAPGEPTG